MLDETNTAGQDSLPKSGQSSDGSKGGTSGTPGTYSAEEYRQGISDALSEAGRRHKLELEPVIHERDSLRTQISTASIALETIKLEREDLQKQIEDLSQEDPKKFDLLTKERDLKNQERKLIADRTQLENDQKANQERLKKVEVYERHENIKAVAVDYEGVTEAQLKALCDRLNINGIENIIAAAENIGKKKTISASTTSTEKPDSTVTSGGNSDYKAIRDAYIKNPNDLIIRQRYLEARRKLGL